MSEQLAAVESENALIRVSDIRKKLGWSNGYMSAVRKAMGVSKGSRFGCMDDYKSFIKKHPDFRLELIYGEKALSESEISRRFRN